MSWTVAWILVRAGMKMEGGESMNEPVCSLVPSEVYEGTRVQVAGASSEVCGVF